MQAIGYRREAGGALAAARHAPASGTRSPLDELDVQQHAIIGACVAHQLDLTVVYTEPVQGASQLRRLLREVREQGATPRVVLPNLDVLATSARERVFRALQLHGQGLDPLLGTGERLEAAMLAAWRSRLPAELHRERVREGMRRLALRGRALGRPPYGYRVEEQRLRIEPPEAQVVQEVMRMYLRDNLGIRRISAALNDAGLRTRRGGPWSAAAVRDMLRNPVYLGTYRRLGVIVPGAHRPLVTRSEFDEIQRRMANRRTSPSEQRRHQYLLGGLARCGYCGNRLIGVRRPGTEATLVYYQCESATNHGRCQYHTRRAAALEAEVRDRLAAGPLQRLHGTPSSGPGQSEVARIEARRRGLQRRIERMIERWAEGEWSLSHFLKEAGARALADLEAEEQLEAATAVAFAVERAGPGALDEVRRRLVEEWDNLPFEARRDLLQHVVAEVIVTDDSVRVALAGAH